MATVTGAELSDDVAIMSIATDGVKDDLLPFVQVLEAFMLLLKVGGSIANLSISGLEPTVVFFEVCDFLQEIFFAGLGMRFVSTVETPMLTSGAGLRAVAIALARKRCHSIAQTKRKRISNLLSRFPAFQAGDGSDSARGPSSSRASGSFRTIAVPLSAAAACSVGGCARGGG